MEEQRTFDPRYVVCAEFGKEEFVQREPREITTEECLRLLREAPYKSAKEYESFNPHGYTRRLKWANDDDFLAVVHHIREHGAEEPFFRKRYRYLYDRELGVKYFSMGAEYHLTSIINRADASKPNEGWNRK